MHFEHGVVFVVQLREKWMHFQHGVIFLLNKYLVSQYYPFFFLFQLGISKEKTVLLYLSILS